MKEYSTACYSGATLTTAEREAGAAQFCIWIKRFQEGGSTALAVLKMALSGTEDGYRRNVAARLITELPNPAAQAFLLKVFTRAAFPSLGSDHLYRLGTKLPLWKGWEDAWQWLPTAHPALRCPLTSALLRKPTERGRVFIEQAFAGGDPWILEGVVKGIAKWKEPELLRRIIAGKYAASASPPTKIELDAAFYLGLASDPIGISFLEKTATETDSELAVEAVMRLAWLARPGAVSLTAGLLKSDNPDIVALALSAAGTLSTARLGAELISVAGRSPEFRWEGRPLADDAIHLLGQLTGLALPPADTEYVFGAVEPELTESTRSKAVMFYEALLPNLISGRRYCKGELLTLAHLAADLLSPHSGPMSNAAFNLRAITGEDYGFDTDNANQG